MLRRILAGLSILSLVAGAALLIFWWRSYHHTDHFAIGKPDIDRTEFTAEAGKVWVATTRVDAGMITKQWKTYPFSQLTGCSLIIPAFWLAITIRAKLPRPSRPPRK